MAVLDIDSGISDRQALALVTLLETFQPRLALKPYLTQLQTIVKDLEEEDPQNDDQHTNEENTIVPSSPLAAEEQPNDDHNENCEDSVQSAAWIDDPVEKCPNPRLQTGLFDKFQSSVVPSPPSSPANRTRSVLTLATIESSFAEDDDDVDDTVIANPLPPLSPNKRPRDNNNNNNNNEHTYSSSRTPIQSPTRSVASLQQQPQQQLNRMSLPSKHPYLVPSTPPPIRPRVPQQQQRSPSPSSRCANRYHDSNRFLDDAHIVFDDDALYHPVHKALDTPSILARILSFDGSLAAYHKNYDLLVGYKTPQTTRPQTTSKMIGQRSCSLAAVNRRFASLILGTEGLEAWKTEARLELESKRAIARQIMGSCSPLAKIFAIVIRNDAIELEYVLSKHITSIQHQGTTTTAALMDHGSDIFGMALKEYVHGGDESLREIAGYPQGNNESSSSSLRSMGLPADHPFLALCSCWKAKECDYTTLLAELAYNAFVCGALDVLEVLSQKHNTLWGTSFGSSGSLLGELLAHACAQPSCLEEITKGIRALMHQQRFRKDDLHACRPRGSLGNSLHMAAAKGDKELVYVLLEIGCDPGVRCDPRAFSEDETERFGENNPWYPEDWARIRGHSKLARFLERERRQVPPKHHPQQRGKHPPAPELQSVLSESSTRYSVASSYYWYGDDGSENSSTCGSDEYDSDDDSEDYSSEDEYTEFTGYTGYTDVDSHFYTSTTEYTYTTDD